MSAMPVTPRRLLCLFVLLPILALGSGPAAKPEDIAGPPLAAGDRIRIGVFGEEELSLNALINDRGTIAYPLLGDLEVAGLTPSELAELVDKRLRGPYLVDPKVTVSVEAYRELFLTGQVKRPGGYPYTPGMTARKAIALAGGYSEKASRGKVFLVPEAEPGKERRIDLDAKVGPGDTLIVKESFF